MRLLPAVKTGRCFNGSEKDRGAVVHLVPAMKVKSAGDWFTKALCGAEPGFRGNGWSETNKEITCPKCIKKRNEGDRFIQGYVCAVANLVRVRGESTEAREMLSACVCSVEQMVLAKCDPQDIEILKPVIKEIIRLQNI